MTVTNERSLSAPHPGGRPRSAYGLWLLVAAAFLGLQASARPAEEAKPRVEGTDEAPTDFLRFVDLKGGEGKLETAIATYARGDGVEVDLVAAVHIADSAYYRALQKRFEGYDALLYEMIKPADVEPVPGERDDNLLSLFQRGLKDALGLEFQLDALDYRKKNFIHADMDPDTFFRIQREKGESVLSLLWKALRKEMELQASGKGTKGPTILELLAAFTSDDSAMSLKLLLARQIEGMELLLAGFDEDDDGTEGSGSVILAERNKVVQRVLKKVLDEGTKKKIGIFYGGGHMPDLERRLIRDLGFRRVRHEWLTAWDIRKAAKEGKAGGTESGKEGKAPDAGKPPADAEKAPGGKRGNSGGGESRPPAPGGQAEGSPDAGERARDF